MDESSSKELLKRFIKDNAGPNLIPDNFIIGKTKVFLKAVAGRIFWRRSEERCSAFVCLESRHAHELLVSSQNGKRSTKLGWKLDALRRKQRARSACGLKAKRYGVNAPSEYRLCPHSLREKYVKSMNDSRVLQRAEADAEKNRDMAPLRNIIDTFRAKVAAGSGGNSMLARRLQKSEARLAQLIDEQEVLGD